MTSAALVRSDAPVALVGGGPVTGAALSTVLGSASLAVAADGGAGALLAHGRMPDAVIGDFDSLSEDWRAQVPPDRLHHIAEQDSTDFHKCLTRIDAPLVLAAGFSAGRMDHFLGVCNVLVRLPARRCIVVGDEDLCLLAPPRIALDLDPGTAVSLFPMGAVTAQSLGLHWPVEGNRFTPDGQSGTSNRAEGPVTLTVHAPKLLLLLPLDSLDAVRTALDVAPGWS